MKVNIIFFLNIFTLAKSSCKNYYFYDWKGIKLLSPCMEHAGKLRMITFSGISTPPDVSTYFLAVSTSLGKRQIYKNKI